MSGKQLVIAIDGPAASGKSTTAKLVAQRLGYLHVDTGAMYRAVTLKVLRKGIKPDDERAIARLLNATHVELKEVDSSLKVFLDSEDVTEAIRSADVTNAVSAVSRLRQVRQKMVLEQRQMGKEKGIVLEGRDIGTVVFPDADLKIFMVADIEARAHRRQAELRAKGVEIDLAVLIKEIEERDRTDSTRHESPLRRAPDSVGLDTSHLTIEEQVECVVRKAKEILEQRKTG